MKVKIIYDFSVEEIEDFSKDKVQIELSYKEFEEIRNFLDEIAIENWGSELGKRANMLGTKLRNYETESKF